MTTEARITQLVAVTERLETLRHAERNLVQIDRDLIAATRDADRAIKVEEAAAANLGYRRKAFAEARETQARMERNPGVNFLGFKSPSRLKLETIRQSVLDHARASDLAFEREDLARKAGRLARSQLAQLAQARQITLQQFATRLDGQSISTAIEKAEREIGRCKASVTEAEIDEAVMHNRIDTRTAAKARSLLRDHRPIVLER